MNWIAEKLIKMLTYPIQWFWTTYEQCKEERSILKIIMLFIISISGLAFFGVGIVYLIYLMSQNVEFVIVAGIIIWIYAYIRSKMNIAYNMQENTQPINQIITTETMMQGQAIKAYPLMRNILYQTLKETAENIGGKTPRIINEIELPENHFIISGAVCYYQFRLAKQDVRMRYQRAETEEFCRMLQAEISNRIQRGDFPTLGLQSFFDEFGNVYDAVLVDTIEDLDAYLIIQTVFYNPYYAEIVRQKNEQIINNDNVPSADWE